MPDNAAPRLLNWLHTAVSVPLLLVVALFIRVLGFKALSRYVLPAPGRRSPPDDRELWRVLRGVQRATQITGIDNCLIRAATAQLIFAAIGREVTICVGVRKDEAGAFGAHAWLTRGHEVVFGGTADEVARYNTIVEFGARRP